MIKDETLKKLDEAMARNALNIEFKEIVLRRCFNEAWFSDTLAWLLNPKGSHNLGVKFANEFLKTIAKLRFDKEKNYQKRNTLFKYGKSKSHGVSVSSFSLKNASSIREFYLAQSIRKRKSRGARFCDIVFLDLDLDDGLFLVVENKLFTSNHPGQLEEYYQLVEDKFKRAKIREYAYLTLNGMSPIAYSNSSTEKRLHRFWVNMSWSGNINDILTNLKTEEEHPEIVQLRKILAWLNRLNSDKSIINLVAVLRKVLLEAAAACLMEELQRLGDGKSGEWKIGKTNKNRVSIFHTSSSKRPLYVELLPNFTITVQARKSKIPLFEKIIVPFGVHPDQIFNLIDIAARDIYYFHFNSSTALYLANKRRLSSTRTSKKEELAYIFNYVYKNQLELKIILASSKYAWEALKNESQEQD